MPSPTPPTISRPIYLILVFLNWIYKHATQILIVSLVISLLGWYLWFFGWHLGRL